MEENTSTGGSTSSSRKRSIILFYKYHPLSSDFDITERYRQALERLCVSLRLKGRILVGCSKTEGINGTLAGTYEDVLCFTKALLRDDIDETTINENTGNIFDTSDNGRRRLEAINCFRKESSKFFAYIQEPELRFDSLEDFKWSVASSNNDDLFPDLTITLRKELIGTGGVLSSISLEETAKGYLTPQEWHDRMIQYKNECNNNNDTILIDCRNTKEYEIGHFDNSIDPKTTTFAQFPKWVNDHKHEMSNKNVLMYCTGGIRCEKASAYIRRTVPSVKEVQHLKGGIHKYLEQYGDNSNVWKGRNFVFDGRMAASGEETQSGREGIQQVDDNINPLSNSVDSDGGVVGRCIECEAPYDQFDPYCVCTVCREPCLVCQNCQKDVLIEYHCRNHAHLKSCYFSNLERFTVQELQIQLKELIQILNEIAVGRRFKQKRKTLLKQIDRIKEQLDLLENDKGQDLLNKPTNGQQRCCRNCGDITCSGRCWGFFGLKRKEIIDKNKDVECKSAKKSSRVGGSMSSVNIDKRKSKQTPKTKQRRDNNFTEIVELGVSMPPSQYRDSNTGIRVPPCLTRVRRCNIKAKWCGQTVLQVVQNEFTEMSRPSVLNEALLNALLRLNDKPITSSEISNIQLKSSDSLSRILHWHEAPVVVPERIQVTMIQLPKPIIECNGLSEYDDCTLLVCNKPSSVPVHPAGPYLSNSLTMMVEAQEGLSPQSLIPLHRTDRVTSGLTLCCKNSIISKVFHRCLSESLVDKLYLAKVCGKFPSNENEFLSTSQNLESAPIQSNWSEEKSHISITAPVFTLDAAAGIRSIDSRGKQSQTLLRFISYDETNDVSLVACQPVTGRNHQIRVHLQLLGFPIVGDIQYGGRSIKQSQQNLKDSDSVRLMTQTINNIPTEKHTKSISNEDVQRAKQACKCCSQGKDGIIESFTPAQLLFEGHTIFLHALKYRIKFFSTKKRNVDDETPLANIELSVDFPEWADESDTSAITDWF